MTSDRFLIGRRLWMVTRPTGYHAYDFDFLQFFDCATPWDAPSGLPAVARVGAFDDYTAFYEECRSMHIHLVNRPEDHQRCTHLPEWYPLIQDLTPRSRWFTEIPSFKEIESESSLPVFIKGARQTSRHQTSASIIRSREDYETATALYRIDPILRWQKFVCREFIPSVPSAEASMARSRPPSSSTPSGGAAIWSATAATGSKPGPINGPPPNARPPSTSPGKPSTRCNVPFWSSTLPKPPMAAGS